LKAAAGMVKCFFFLFSFLVSSCSLVLDWGSFFFAFALIALLFFFEFGFGFFFLG